MGKLTVRVQRIREEAIDIKSFELVSTSGAALPAFTPGAHVDVEVAEGVVRQYSLCGSPAHRASYRIAVKREAASRGGSQALHDRVREGDQLTLSEPRNNFPLNHDAQHHLLVAGGIGVTPLLSMVQHLLALGAPFELHYFSRSIQHMAFHELLSDPSFAGKVVFHYAVEPDAVRASLRKLLWRRPEGGHLYLCGPRPFMDLVEQTAAATWAPEAVHLEYFSANPSSLSGPRETFRVRLARRGIECTVAADKTIIEALREHGVEIESSCEQGVCGTCLTGLLEGCADHRDAFLRDDEKQAGDKILPCVSRSLSDMLVLDL